MEENLDLEAEMGESINFENVLTIITVLLLLRTIFMVPLVNMDKVKMEMVTKDRFWASLATWLDGKQPSPLQEQYISALEAEDRNLVITDLSDRRRYFEFKDPDGDVHVVLHHMDSGKFTSMISQDAGGVLLYRSGFLKWSARDKEWFTDKGQIIPPGDPQAAQMLAEYRRWTKESRGF